MWEIVEKKKNLNLIKKNTIVMWSKYLKTKWNNSYKHLARYACKHGSDYPTIGSQLKKKNDYNKVLNSFNENRVINIYLSFSVS